MTVARSTHALLSMPKKPRARPSLADRFCEAIKELTTERQTRTYAAQWIMVYSVAFWPVPSPRVPAESENDSTGRKTGPSAGRASQAVAKPQLERHQSSVGALNKIDNLAITERL